MNYLLTMAHGAEHYRQEALYLLLTWLRHRGEAPDAGIALVATDRPDSFRRILGEFAHIRYLPLEPARLLEWRGGPHGYVHRIKPQLIAHAARLAGIGPQDALLFVDSDTAFLDDPRPLFDACAQGRVVLHAREGTIASNRRHTRSQGRLYAMARRTRFDFADRRQQFLPLDQPLWNSGALGLRGDLVEPLMRETLELTDRVCAAMELATAEQVALSMVLAARGHAVVAAEDRLLHYHVFKEFRADIARWLEHHAGASPAQWVALAAEIDPWERIRPKLAFNRLPKWRRQIARRLGRGWRPLPYPWSG